MNRPLMKKTGLVWMLIMTLLCCPLMEAGAEQALVEESIDLSDSLFHCGGFPTTMAVRGRSSWPTKAEQFIFEQLYNEVETIDVASYQLTRQQLQALYQHICNNYGELFYLGGKLSFTSLGGYVYRIYPKYANTPAERAVKRRQLNGAVAAACQYARQSTSPLVQALLLNDYLCSKVSYDTDRENYDAYSMLVETRTGTCQAYMLTYNLMLRAMGLNCTYAVSEEIDHAWSLVSIDGQWYHVDPTWNDMGAIHTYFLCSDEKMERTGHGEWVASVNALDDRYDKAFWCNINTSMPIHGNTIYYVDDGTNRRTRYLRAWDSDSDTVSTLHQFDARWPLSTSGVYYPKYMGNLTVQDGMIYYVVPRGVCAIPVNGGTAQQVFTLEDEEKYHLYHTTFSDGVMYYTVGTDQNSTYRTGTWTLAQAAPKVNYIRTTLSAAMTEIEAGAFANSTAVSYLVDGGGLTTIGEEAFKNCQSLRFISLGSQVKSIANSAFDGCDESLVFICPRDSYAWNYAISHGYLAQETE